MDNQERHILRTRANVLKALAHPARLWMVGQLERGERCVCELVEGLDIDFSTVSKHLLVLKNAGIVEDDKRGKQVFYSLRIPCVMNFMHCVDAVLENAKLET
ncbi:MAG: metalloregulator ArsR/SmtB family transcription factor [Kiritimatiellae bacterium]|nr:metalloregulator ArsR/SmtB family transcription factor [Kiritimatiellia bacterium]MDD3545628.1 metalloregulator ArsR/SmtB family transcription factor [Kiritimatiellia bacterium]MDD4025518.1 metalloregulator ArsR/SmtB family transcription factor [Kiritimatiellia bacterium]MDD4623653.1 metalloregulator ArsR/SmtB family transcription factor [Kiritimatiellia bacterium]